MVYTKVGPVVLDPEVAAEVGELMGEDVAVFGGLVRRDTPGETARVRIEVGREQVISIDMCSPKLRKYV